MPARLIDSLWVASYGDQLASGSVRFFAPNTTTPVNVFSDDAATVVITQPVPLDADGRTTSPVYAVAPMRAILYDADGAQIVDIERIDGDRAELSALVNTQWPAAASVDAALTALAVSHGTTNGLVKVTGVGATGRTLQAKLSELPSVKDFGAVGTGTVDDFGSITAAIAAVNAAGGGTLYLPPGNYLVSQTVTLLSGVSIRGAGASASVITNSSATGNAMTGGLGLKRFFLEDFGLANSGASTGVGLYLNGCAYVTMSRLKISGYRYCIDSTDNGNPSTASQYHRIRDCELIAVNTNSAARCVRMAGTVNVNGSSGNHVLTGNIWGGNGAVLGNIVELLENVSNVSLMNNVHVPDFMANGVVVDAAHTGKKLFMFGNDFSGITTTGLLISRATGPTVVEYANIWPDVVDSSDGTGAIFGGTTTADLFRWPPGAGWNFQTLLASGTAVIDLSKGNWVDISAQLAGSTITIPAPVVVNYLLASIVTITCRNDSGGAVTWTFAGAYVTSAAVAPASGARVSVTFRYNGSWREIARSPT
jgi:hypothetical protein